MMKKYYTITGLLLLIIVKTSFLWSNNPVFDKCSCYISCDNNDIVAGTRLDLSMSGGCCSINSDGKYNFGFSLFSDNYIKNFPIKISIGQLSYGGIISELNNPELASSTEGLSSCFSNPVTLYASLPSYLSFSNPFSMFMEFCYRGNNSVFREFLINSIFIPETKEISLSADIKMSFTESFNMFGTFGISLFNQKKRMENSWYMDVPDYHDNRTFCLASQLYINIFSFAGNFSIFTYKTPYGKIKNVYRAENKFESSHIKISTSAYFNNSNLIISRNNKILNPCAQLKCNIQYNLNFGLNNQNSLITGSTFYYNIPLTKNIHNFNFGTESSLKLPVTSLTLKNNFSYKIDKDLKKIYMVSAYAYMENKWNFKYLYTTLGISSKYYIYSNSFNNKKKYTIKLNLELPDKNFTNSNYFSFSIDNKKLYNINLNTGLNINILYKKLFIFVKINANFTF